MKKMWIKKDGLKIPVSQMESNHIFSCLKMILTNSYKNFGKRNLLGLTQERFEWLIEELSSRSELEKLEQLEQHEAHIRELYFFEKSLGTR